MPWGHVLDAGSGTHSLEWISELKTERWTALTGDNIMKKAIEKEFFTEMRNKVNSNFLSYSNFFLLSKLGPYFSWKLERSSSL